MKKNYKQISKTTLFILLACLIFSSCQKELESPDKIEDKNYIDQEKAVSVAKDFSNGLLNKNFSKKKSFNVQSATTKNVKSIKNIKSKNGLNVFYIINYEGGGFAVVSADKRTLSILAYSDKSVFRTDTVPSGVDEWLNSTKLEIEEVRKQNIPYKGQDKIALFKTTNTNFSVKAEPECNPCCVDEFEEVLPLIQTTWGQSGGYNNLMPQLSCVPSYNNGRAYTGCVATAMAQIIRYHQYPANWYNYTSMPNFVDSWNMFSAGTNEIAKIMYDAATAVNAKYTCEGTGADTQEDVAAAFENFFGYSTSANYLDYSGTSNYDAVKNELRANRPVIFRGGRNDSWWIFPVYKDGHAWVSDGFQRSFFCNSGEYLYFHMNWGWDPNNSYNGWYGFNDFTPGDNTFNYKSGVVVGIKP